MGCGWLSFPCASSRWYILTDLLNCTFLKRVGCALILLFYCLFRQAIDETRELMAPIIRMNGKLDRSEMDPAHPIRGPPYSHLILRGRAVSTEKSTNPDMASLGSGSSHSSSYGE